MGGHNSGRRGGWATVEGCGSLVLSADRVMRGVHKAVRVSNMQAPSDGHPWNIPWHT